MSEFIDGLALPFALFAELAEPRWYSFSSMSFVNPQCSYSVSLTGRIARAVPETARSQRFDESFLLPISKELGLDLTKTAILIVLRNAWIAYFQESEISKISIDEIRLLMTMEIAAEYVVLTSAKWLEHPWIQEQINQPPQVKELPTTRVLLDNPMGEMHRQAWIEKQESDINFHITNFSNMKGSYTSNVFMEIDAEYASSDIKHAKKRIKALNAEVEQQEAIIRMAMRPVRKLQNYEKSLRMKRAPGRPKSSEAQQERRGIATKFVAQWISSLMAELSITSCDELAKIMGGQKMTWWRWLNNETLPPSSYLEPLLDVEIKSGDHKSTKLRDIQTTPSLIDLIALVDLV